MIYQIPSLYTRAVNFSQLQYDEQPRSTYKEKTSMLKTLTLQSVSDNPSYLHLLSRRLSLSLRQWLRAKVNGNVPGCSRMIECIVTSDRATWMRWPITFLQYHINLLYIFLCKRGNWVSSTPCSVFATDRRTRNLSVDTVLTAETLSTPNLLMKVKWPIH